MTLPLLREYGLPVTLQGLPAAQWLPHPPTLLDEQWYVLLRDIEPVLETRDGEVVDRPQEDTRTCVGEEARIQDLAELKPDISPLGPLGPVPLFTVREKGSDKWIPLPELSSGMQKVLLILSDLFIIPEQGVYLIDEYENSLGISAIDFFPEFLADFSKPIQFLLTSHHPYIINEIPPRQWYIFHRRGMQVLIRHGEEVVKRFGASKQQAFIQLINDPFFTAGVE